MSYRNPTETTLEARRKAKSDMAYSGTVQKRADKDRRNRATVMAGGRSGMSEVDQNALIRGTNANTQRSSDMAILAQRTGVRSPVDGGEMINLDVNRPSTGSPVAAAPPRMRLNVPDPLSGPGGNAQTDAAALAQNLSLARNPTQMIAPATTQVQDARRQASRIAAEARTKATGVIPVFSKAEQTVAPTMGAVVPTAQADALLGPVTGANGYGTGSVRTAQPGETLTAATTTDAGVSRAGPFDQVKAHNELAKSHPAIWQAGSPENLAFLAHAKKYGVQAAYQNAPALMATLTPHGSGGPTGQQVKNDMGGAPSAEQLAAVEAGLPSVAEQAGEKARGVVETAKGVGRAIKGAPRALLGAADRASAALYKGFTGEAGNSRPVTTAIKSVLPDPIAQPQPSVPPAQAPPVSETIDQDKLKKRLNPTS